MKYIIAFVCVAGIAIISAAPFPEDTPAAIAAEEGQNERAAEIPVTKISPEGTNERAMETHDRAAEIPVTKISPEGTDERAMETYETEEKAANEESAANERAANEESAAHEERAAKADRADRALIPSVRELIDAVETKYLTPDGKALIKSFIPLA